MASFGCSGQEIAPIAGAEFHEDGIGIGQGRQPFDLHPGRMLILRPLHANDDHLIELAVRIGKDQHALVSPHEMPCQFFIS